MTHSIHLFKNDLEVVKQRWSRIQTDVIMEYDGSWYKYLKHEIKVQLCTNVELEEEDNNIRTDERRYEVQGSNDDHAAQDIEHERQVEAANRSLSTVLSDLKETAEDLKHIKDHLKRLELIDAHIDAMTSQNESVESSLLALAQAAFEGLR